MKLTSKTFIYSDIRYSRGRGVTRFLCQGKLVQASWYVCPFRETQDTDARGSSDYNSRLSTRHRERVQLIVHWSQLDIYHTIKTWVSENYEQCALHSARESAPWSGREVSQIQGYREKRRNSYDQLCSYPILDHLDLGPPARLIKCNRVGQVVKAALYHLLHSPIQ